MVSSYGQAYASSLRMTSQQEPDRFNLTGPKLHKTVQF